VAHPTEHLRPERSVSAHLQEEAGILLAFFRPEPYPGGDGGRQNSKAPAGVHLRTTLTCVARLLGTARTNRPKTNGGEPYDETKYFAERCSKALATSDWSAAFLTTDQRDTSS
jgi:hypothetical protein